MFLANTFGDRPRLFHKINPPPPPPPPETTAYKFLCCRLVLRAIAALSLSVVGASMPTPCAEYGLRGDAILSATGL